MAMAIVLGRAIYTHHKRSKNDFPFSTASTAMPPNYGSDESGFVHFSENNSNEEKKQVAVILSEKTSIMSNTVVKDDSMAILPQHITRSTTTLVFRESFPPLRHGCFDITDANGEALFRVEREFPSLSRRRHIIDVKTGNPLLTVRRDVGSLPRSYYLEDPSENKVLELQGKFKVPFQGPRSAAMFIDAISGQKIELFMQGTWLNRNVEILEKSTGRVVARAERDILTLRNAVGGRKTYTATVEAGIDMVLVVGLIMALDERADS